MRRVLIFFLCAGCSTDTFLFEDAGDGGSPLDSYVVDPDAGDTQVDGADASDARGDASVEAGTEAGPTFKRVFISSTTTESNFGGLAAADAVCSARALAAGLGGTWKAWLSTSTTSAASRLAHASVPYQLVDGTTIATSWSDLVSGAIKDPINKNENGVFVPDNSSTLAGFAWTGTMTDGTADSIVNTCQDWTVVEDCGVSTSYHAGIGDDGVTTASWTYGAGNPCCTGTSLAFYCFEQ
jgi:hypothetical protein